MNDQMEANGSPMRNDHGELTRNLLRLLGGALDANLDAVSKAKIVRIAADALYVEGYRKYRTASALKIGRIIAMELESTKRSSATHDPYTKGWVGALLMIQDHLPHEDTEIDREHGGIICSECGWHFVSKFLRGQAESQAIAHDIHATECSAVQYSANGRTTRP